MVTREQFHKKRCNIHDMCSDHYNIPGTKELTHWDRDKMAAFRKLHIMKIYEVRLIFHWIFVPKYSIIGWDNGSAPTMRQAIIWTNDGKFNDEYMRHSASMS